MADRERDFAAMRNEHQTELDSLRSSLVTQHAAQIKAMTSQFEATIVDLQNQTKEFPKKIADAVTETKSKVYDKVKTQFENGNKEFQKVKQALKDVQTDAEAKLIEIQKLKQNEIILNTTISTLKEESVESIARLVSAQTVVWDVLQVIMPSVVGMPISATALLSSDVIKQHSSTIIESIKRLQIELSCSQTNLTSGRAAVTSIENSLRTAETTIVTVSCRVTAQEDRAGVAEALLSTVRTELNEVRSDRDQQMLAVAKLASVNASLEDTVTQLKTESDEAVERCNSLRAMNEELLMMMEKSFSPDDPH